MPNGRPRRRGLIPRRPSAVNPSNRRVPILSVTFYYLFPCVLNEQINRSLYEIPIFPTTQRCLVSYLQLQIARAVAGRYLGAPTRKTGAFTCPSCKHKSRPRSLAPVCTRMALARVSEHVPKAYSRSLSPRPSPECQRSGTSIRVLGPSLVVALLPRVVEGPLTGCWPLR